MTMKIHGRDYDTEIRPLLAEFVDPDKWTGLATDWDRTCFAIIMKYGDVPDPLRSHSDCHALIEALSLAGFTYDYCKRRNNGKTSICLQSVSTIRQFWDGDDYREGVVTLAAPIAREAKE